MTEHKMVKIIFENNSHIAEADNLIFFQSCLLHGRQHPPHHTEFARMVITNKEKPTLGAFFKGNFLSLTAF